MKKTIINIYLVIILSILLLGCSNAHSHKYIDGICTCGETIIHIHQFIDERCECGVKGPHTHNYNNGICMCGEYDTNYIKNHNHVYKDGICSCGEKEINHSHTYKYGICECGEYQNHKHIYLYDNYRVCYCGYIDKHIHNYIEGKCSCGIKEGKENFEIKEYISEECNVKSIKDYEDIYNYLTLVIYGNPEKNFYYKTLTNWIINEINIPSIAINDIDQEIVRIIEDSLGIELYKGVVHYDFNYYLELWCSRTVEVTIYENGYVKWKNPNDGKIYISIEKVDYYKIMNKIESYRWMVHLK